MVVIQHESHHMENYLFMFLLKISQHQHLMQFGAQPEIYSTCLSKADLLPFFIFFTDSNTNCRQCLVKGYKEQITKITLLQGKLRNLLFIARYCKRWNKKHKRMTRFVFTEYSSATFIYMSLTDLLGPPILKFIQHHFAVWIF